MLAIKVIREVLSRLHELHAVMSQDAIHFGPGRMTASAEKLSSIIKWAEEQAIDKTEELKKFLNRSDEDLQGPTIVPAEPDGWTDEEVRLAVDRVVKSDSMMVCGMNVLSTLRAHRKLPSSRCTCDDFCDSPCPVHATHLTEIEDVFEQLSDSIHARARSKGFYDDDEDNSPIRFFLSLLALLHSEVSECTEEVRRGLEPDQIERYQEDGKPEGILSELVDVLIRVFDIVGWLDYHGYSSVTGFVRVFFKKSTYNEGRPNRHGKRA